MGPAEVEGVRGIQILDEDPVPQVPDGSRALALVQSLRWFRNPVDFMEVNQRRFGGSFSVRLGPLERCSFIADPQMGWQVLSASSELMRMGSTNGIFRPVLGDASLFLLDGEEHRRHRRLVMPAFHRGAVMRFASLLREIAAREVSTWPTGRTISLQDRMRGVTLEMIFRITLGVVDPARDRALRSLIRGLLESVRNPIAVLPWFQRDLGGRTPYARLMRQVADIEALLYEEIAERRYDPSRLERDDVLSMLVRPESHEDGYLSDREIRDELLTLLIAGHETTATAIAWTFERLLRHPAALDRLTSELDHGSGEPYLDAVIREALRLRPVLPVTARKLTRPVRIGEFHFPKGWTLMPCIYLMHRDPDVFPDPNTFRPERFLEHPIPSSRTWIPFGGGPRHCIGSSLSMLAIKVIVPAVLDQVRLEPDHRGSEAIVRQNFTLGPASGATASIVGRRDHHRVTRSAGLPSGQGGSR